MDIALRAAASRLTATADRRTIEEGGSVVVRGRLTGSAATGWQPLGGVPLGVLFGMTDDGDPVSQVTTDADGRYQVTVSPY